MKTRFALLTLLLGLGSSAHATLFNLTSTGNALADAGFSQAAATISAFFNDPVTVNITAGFANLGPGILGSASSNQASYGFGAWKGAMAADATSADDATMVAGLPGGATYGKLINRTSDNPNGANSATPYLHGGITQVRLSNGNAKALGLIAGNAAGQDAAITFSNQFAWDFDRTDGIGAGLLDFVGVAIHELMHAMGFISGVDILDINNPLSNPPGGLFPGAAFDPFASGLDFTRHSAASVAAGANMDWTVDNRNKAFSIDGGASFLVGNAWSTGRNFGDGQQASHWRDNLGLGIMDPTAQPPGALNLITPLDLQALDVIGWNAAQVQVPEPNVVVLMLTGAFLLQRARRRRT